MMYRVQTSHPLALTSPDHQDAVHGGAANDNSRHPGFNQKLERLFGRKVSVLDLGCAGGGFVKSLLDDGHQAVGLEGSDYCKRHGKFEWVTVPDNLFTCDVSEPFSVEQARPELGDDVVWRPATFDVVTCWEVMEHFLAEQVPQVIRNVLAHFDRSSLWVMSVSRQADRHFHRCVRPREWWMEMFTYHGLRHREDIRDWFDPDWVRGPEKTPWAFAAPDSFHLVLQRKKQ